ncbi:MAG TPA: hypothetical protein VKA65_10515 [Acidimicrobiales bacterium]|nr:hypothetical protein [Acidimicrobiales bacterium]
MTSAPRWAREAAGAVARRPGLWPVAVRQAFVLAEPGWWHRRPFLPLPPVDYLRFRSQTAYGGSGDRPPGREEVVIYLRWCRDIRRERRP